MPSQPCPCDDAKPKRACVRGDASGRQPVPVKLSVSAAADRSRAACQPRPARGTPQGPLCGEACGWRFARMVGDAARNAPVITLRPHAATLTSTWCVRCVGDCRYRRGCGAGMGVAALALAQLVCYKDDPTALSWYICPGWEGRARRFGLWWNVRMHAACMGDHRRPRPCLLKASTVHMSPSRGLDPRIEVDPIKVEFIPSRSVYSASPIRTAGGPSTPLE